MSPILWTDYTNCRRPECDGVPQRHPDPSLDGYCRRCQRVEALIKMRTQAQEAQVSR